MLNLRNLKNTKNLYFLVGVALTLATLYGAIKSNTFDNSKSTTTSANSATQSTAYDDGQSPFHKFLTKYRVTSELNTTIKYDELKRNPEPLNILLADFESLRSKDFENLSSDEKLATLINAYNISAIKLVVDKYPVQDWNHVGGFFGIRNPSDRSILKMAGRSWSLNDLLIKIMETNKNKPNVLFALACPMKSCPDIRHEPYTKAWVNQQIDDEIHLYLKNPNKVKASSDLKNLTFPNLWENCASSWLHPRECRGNYFKSPDFTKWIQALSPVYFDNKTQPAGIHIDFSPVISTINDSH